MIQDMDGAMEWLSTVKVRIINPSTIKKEHSDSTVNKESTRSKKVFAVSSSEFTITRDAESVRCCNCKYIV